MPSQPQHSRTASPTATLLGVTAIAFWSTIIAVSRSMTEHLGTLTSGAALYLLAGALGSLPLLATQRRRDQLRRLPRPYVLYCGGLFVGYGVLLYAALGLSATRQQVLEVTVINYLWPGLTLAFSVPLLKNKARVPFLLVGVLLCMVGVALAAGITRPAGGGAAPPLAHYLPHLLAVGAALSWPLYSNLSRLWAGEAEGNGVPLFLFATGILLLAMRCFHPEQTHWTAASAAEIGYAAVFPMLLGYVCWDVAMRKGNLPVVAALSYLTPVLSLTFSSLYLRVPLTTTHWTACLLVVVGAVACKLGIVEGSRDGGGPG
jgi:drug/metabolite transporter (DMT)-like permease